MISIIIPAFNEMDVIARSLRSLLDGADAGELDIVVVCNGCTDDTVSVARGFEPAVTVIETPVANKTNALNMGDSLARGYPRFYIDADVIVSVQAIRAVAERLDQGDVLLCSPCGRFETGRSSWAVRTFFHIRSLLPSAREGNGGSGVYALSEVGRRRFGQFPNVVADDTYVRFQFSRDERATLLDTQSTVFPPRTLDALIRVRSRLYYGTIELRQQFRDVYSHDSRANIVALAGLLRRPRLWLGILIYSFVSMAARVKAHARSRRSGSGQVEWLRDDTTRSLQG